MKAVADGFFGVNKTADEFGVPGNEATVPPGVDEGGVSDEYLDGDLHNERQGGDPSAIEDDPFMEAMTGLKKMLSFLKNHTSHSSRLSCFSILNEIRCYETKIEESEKAGSHQESNPGHLWLEPPVLCH